MVNTPDTVESAAPRARWSIAGAFLECLTTRDYDRLAKTLAHDVRLRALQTAGPSEWHGRAEAAGAFRSWFAAAERFEIIDATVGEIAGRIQITWRIRLRPAPFDTAEGWHVIEQHAFADIAETIEALDLVCSGFWPERTSNRQTSTEDTT